MFPGLRPPSEGSTPSGLLTPMAAAACGMFGNPNALLGKDPSALYPTAPGSIPGLPYPYGAPGMMSPLSALLPPQYPVTSSAMLDYSRAATFPYGLSWATTANSFPPAMMSPEAMAAAVAAASANSAAAVAAAKRRDEMEAANAADLSAKRGLPPGMTPAMAAALACSSISPMEYAAAYRNLSAAAGPNAALCGMDSSMYDKNMAEMLRKRQLQMMEAAASKANMDSPYISQMPDPYRMFWSCRCYDNRPEDIRNWSVDDVAKFVASVDGCNMYAEVRILFFFF